jgi:hypothetical protein
MSTDPHDGIDPTNNKESRGVERDQTASVSRAGSSGTAPATSGPGDEQPDQAVAGGTAGGDALAGLVMSDEDAADAVSGDTGPEHPGQRS